MANVDWDDYARTYRQIERHPHVPELVVRVLRDLAGTAVDVGCGEGDLLERLSASFPGWEFTGFEVSGFRARVARERGLHVVVDEHGDFSGEFDFAISQHVIEHVQDDIGHVAQLSSLVVPGGHVYVETPLKLRGAWYFRRNQAAGWVLDPTHLREYRSLAELVRVVESAGLLPVSVTVTPLRFPLTAAVALAERLTHLRLPRAYSGELTLPIPRYRVAAVLARKPSS